MKQFENRNVQTTNRLDLLKLYERIDQGWKMGPVIRIFRMLLPAHY